MNNAKQRMFASVNKSIRIPHKERYEIGKKVTMRDQITKRWQHPVIILKVREGEQGDHSYIIKRLDTSRTYMGNPILLKKGLPGNSATKTANRT